LQISADSVAPPNDKLHENRLINGEDSRYACMNNRIRRRLLECRRLAERDKKLQKKLLFFRSLVIVHLSISTKLCVQIEDVCTIFVTDNYYGSDP